jgi:hypothetical protein
MKSLPVSEFKANVSDLLDAVNPSTGTWVGVGKPGEWSNTIAGTVLAGKLYTVESNGALYETIPSTAAWRQIGKAEFADTRFLFAASGSLYSIEKNGRLYRISPSDGSWGEIKAQ